MASEQDLTTHGRARLSFASEADIDEFVSVLEKYERGEITPDQWRAFRLVRGTYGQRQAADAQMLRVKIPQGVISSPQLQVLADIGERYSRKFGHITTRQNIQFHFVQAARRRAGDADAGGRRHHHPRGVRQFGAQYHDVPVRRHCRPTNGSTSRRTPKRRPAFCCGIGSARRCRASSRLRSKGARRITPSIAINDLAFHAQLGPDGARGFRVMAGGGTAIMCKSAGIIHEFMPRREILRVCEAMLRVFKAARRLPAQAAESDEVHDQGARVGRVARGYERALDDCRARRRRAASDDRSAGPEPRRLGRAATRRRRT